MRQRRTVDRDNKSNAFAMGRTLSLLIALACLSTPELARQFAGGKAIWTAGESKALAGSSGLAQTGKVLGVFRAPGACLKLARNSSLRALYQWMLSEAEPDAGVVLTERVSMACVDVPLPSAGPPSYHLFQRPPPVTNSFAA